MARPKGSKNIPKDLAVVAPDNTDKQDIKVINKGGRPVKYDSADKLNDAITKYFNLDYADNVVPTWHDMLEYLGVSDTSVLRYRNNEDNKYPGFGDAIKRAERLHCNFWQTYAVQHPNLQSFCMFELKQPHNGGFIDRPKDEKTDMTIQVNLGFDGKKAE